MFNDYAWNAFAWDAGYSYDVMASSGTSAMSAVPHLANHAQATFAGQSGFAAIGFRWVFQPERKRVVKPGTERRSVAVASQPRTISVGYQNRAIKPTRDGSVRP